jgi:uncharacterized protein
MWVTAAITDTSLKLAACSGYSVDGGGFNNAIGSCAGKGWLARNGNFEITDDGVQVLGSYAPLPSGNALLEQWKAKLGKAEREILAAFASNSPLTKAELAEMTNYAATGGGFNNALGRLRTLELIVGSATLSLTKDFAEAIAA